MTAQVGFISAFQANLGARFFGELGTRLEV